MNNKTLTFSKFQLYIESEDEIAETRVPKQSDFKDSTGAYRYVDKNNVYESNQIVDKDFWFIFINYGNSEPRGEKVYDFKENKKLKNPRTSSQAELKDQLFAYYDFKNEILYLNNSNKKKIIIKILKETTHLIFNIKNIYIEVEDFIAKLKEVNSFEFTSEKDIFSLPNEEAQRRALEDLTGTTAPKVFKVQAKYHKNSSYSIFNFLKKMGKKVKANQLKGLIIKGKSESGFERVYNTDTLIQKEVLKHVTVDENNQFDPENVLKALQKQIDLEN
ncbi:hypothetical protein [Lactobacillus intestinalis]|uniref:hypothetical protein n=1 Tax=Lactobacillus intestinalis TaxID=151781 RepID=UPI0024330D38|nr:hypothetical protein [Lactobacillus intestinalis]